MSNKIITLDHLTTYDEKIKKYISENSGLKIYKLKLGAEGDYWNWENSNFTYTMAQEYDAIEIFWSEDGYKYGTTLYLKSHFYENGEAISFCHTCAVYNGDTAGLDASPKIDILRVYSDNTREHDSKELVTFETDYNTEQYKLNFYGGPVNIPMGGGEEITLASTKDVDEKIAPIVEVAEGKTNTYVIDCHNNDAFFRENSGGTLNLEDSPIITIQNQEIYAKDLKVGDIILVRNLDVPDRWVAANNQGYVTFELLEILKVEVPLKTSDLTNDSGFITIEDVKNTPNLIETTYAELKSLRDNSQLTPGTFYRITDYECTTVQENTKSAGHQFDIIVRADDVNVLNETAWAIHHKGDTYFEKCDLSAWELKYCLDNDSSRFDWADESGKGVIYYMKDNYGNECPYDFKNILYIVGASYTSEGTSYYTFSFTPGAGSLYDATVEQSKGTIGEGDYLTVYNIIKPYKVPNGPSKDLILHLNRNIFKGWGGYYNNTLGQDCHDNTFDTRCHNNTFGNRCYSNTFGGNCNYNTFGNECYNNTFGDYCGVNTFDEHCYFNTFKNYCGKNTFGINCHNNTFDYDCRYNTFGSDCYNNTFSTYCYSNTFGYNCYNNTFGSSCKANIFNIHCTNNNISNSIINSTFGADCYYNTILGSYQTNITFDSGCSFISLNWTISYVGNIHIHSGVKGNSTTNMKAISVSGSSNYETNIVAPGSITIEA